MGIDGLNKLLHAEAMAIASAPILFATALIALGGLIWAVMRWGWKARYDAAQESIKLLERRVADYTDKLSGATPDEARVRIDALEALVRSITPRRLSASQRVMLINMLKLTIGEVAFQHDFTDSDRLAEDLRRCFEEAGWTGTDHMGVGGGVWGARKRMRFAADVP